MNRKPRLCKRQSAVCALLAVLAAPTAVSGAPPRTAGGQPAPSAAPPDTSGGAAASSVEQGQTELDASFDQNLREWRLEKRRQAFADTEFKFNLRTMYLGRDKYDGSNMQSMAIGGWAGLKTGYFLDHISFGLTGYTSQHLAGDDDEDGALMLEPGQEGYSVLGEAYADIKIIDGLNLYAGRKEYDTPYINRNDIRMTPNTFEALTLMGKAKLGEDSSLKYGLGYFNRIKERNSVDFVPMSEDAGAAVDRGVYTVGAVYQRGKFSFGLIDYYSPDIINIGYAEAKMEFEACGLKPRLALQYSDQRSTGDELLKGNDFESRQFGVKLEVPVGQALFTAGYTTAGGDANMQNPWSGYPGYTSVQVEDFNRDGEEAFILRAGYDFKRVKGLSAYALWVHGTDPQDSGQYGRDEFDVNLQWAPPEGQLKGLSFRVRYAHVDQRGSGGGSLDDFRVIANYGFSF